MYPYIRILTLETKMDKDDYLESLYNARIDSTRSDNYYDCFDCCLGEITFCLTSGETGDMIKEYTVRFNEETGEIDHDVEWNTENDGGYCCYNRLPKSVKAHAEAIAQACIIELDDVAKAVISDFEEGYNPLGKFKETEKVEDKSMLNMILIPKSGNEKTGEVIATYTEKGSCPDRCPFKNSGCYGESFHTNQAWERCNLDNDPRQVGDESMLKVSLEMACRVQAKTKDVIVFRHNVAGDLSKDGVTIHKPTLTAIHTAVDNARSVLKGMGKELASYTYTHCDPKANIEAIKASNAQGFLINASCETVQEAQEAVSMGLPAVLTTFDVEGDIEALKSRGVKACQCPAQTKGITCAECKLCARQREAVVLFEVHGSSKKKATNAIKSKRVIMLKVEK